MSSGRNDPEMVSMAKKTLTHKVFSEWDVARRTAEFFDGFLGNLRTVGLTASVTLIGIAFEFKVSPLLLAASVLNVALLFIDWRYQAYLGVSAKYAMNIEKEYDFCSIGLTCAITAERDRHKIIRPENVFRAIYVVLAILGIFGFLILFKPNLIPIQFPNQNSTSS
jgi:hypothetical protein